MHLIRTIFFLMMPICVFGQSVSYEELIIDSLNMTIIHSDGRKASAPHLQSRMKTHVGDLFSQTTFDGDLKMLSQEFTDVIPQLTIHGDTLSIDMELTLKPVIRQIQFHGNYCFSNNRLLTESTLKPGTVFERSALSQALRKLKTCYIMQGFFEVEVDYHIEPCPSSDEVDLIFTICEGRSGKIKNICFHNFETCEQEAILERMITKEWSFIKSWFTNQGIYNQDAMQHDQYMIIDYLHNRGYADAKVEIEICESETSGKIDVHIRADKGLLYTFGPLTFEGSTLFNQEKIASCFKIHEGQRYSPEKIRETVMNILNLSPCC